MDLELPVTADKKKRPLRRRTLRPLSVQASPPTIRYLLAFVVLFGLAMTSGLFYYLVPRDWNWTASKAALIVHIAGGTASLAAFFPYVIAHQKDEEGNGRNLILPWQAFHRQDGESDWIYRQRVYGHILNWSIILLGFSGMGLILPGLLWLGGIVWLPGYLAYRVGNAAHLGLSLLALAFIGRHMVRRRRRRKGSRQ